MLKFENTTTKESFEKSVKWSGNKIEEMKNHTKIKDCGKFQIVVEMSGMCYLLVMLMSTVFHIEMYFQLIF